MENQVPNELGGRLEGKWIGWIVGFRELSRN